LTIGHSYAVDVNRRLAHAIAAAGAGRWEVTVAAPMYFAARKDIRPAVLRVAPGEPCPVIPLPARLTRQVHIFSYGMQLRKILRQGWDLVHAWEEPYICAGWQIGRGVPAGTPFVFRSAQSLPKDYPFPFSRFERRTVDRAAGWICSGEQVQTNLLARPGYAARPHAVIPLGVDAAAFHVDAAVRAATLRTLGWADDGTPVIGYLGRFVPEKGVALLTRVLERLKGPWRAVFLGGGPLEAMLREWAAPRGEQVRILTDVTHAEVPKQMAAFDALALPSQTTPAWAEQFGRAIIEAFAAGVPVVASDSGEIPNVVRGTGVIVPEADEAAWAAALQALLADAPRRARYIHEGRERARTEFDWSIVGRRHIEFFTQLLDARRT
jgi:glycosyltransferase involved in cell wall biosynthesis